MHRFDRTIIGLNYLSLVDGLVSCRRKRVAIIDDVNVKMEGQWCSNIGEVEASFLKNLGGIYNIDTLKSLDNFLTPTNTVIYLDEKPIELASRPLANIRELARKLPELFSTDFINVLAELDADLFDSECATYFKWLADKAYDSNGPQDVQFFTQIPGQHLPQVYKHFLQMLSKDEGFITKHLYYVLQVLYQTIFSSRQNEMESYYLLTSILTPRYTFKRRLLEESLSFEYKVAGGEIFKANVENWEVFNGDVKFILLDSFEGLVHSDQFAIMGTLDVTGPFALASQEKKYEGIYIECQLEHEFLNHYLNKRLIFARLSHLGTDYPHWEMFITESGVMHATLAYSSNAGSKPSFYYNLASQMIIESLSQIFPGLDIELHLHRMHMSHHHIVWEEVAANLSSDFKLPRPNDTKLYTKEGHQKMQSLTYWGPTRSKAMGLLSYLMQLNADIRRQINPTIK